MEDLIVLLKVLDLLHDFFENFGAVLCSAFHSDCDPKGTHCCGKQCRRIYICLFCAAKCLLGSAPNPFVLHCSNAGCASLRDAFYPVMLSGSLRTCMRCDAASAREAYFICSGTDVSRSAMSHACIHSASSFCASSAASRRTYGVTASSKM